MMANNASDFQVCAKNPFRVRNRETARMKNLGLCGLIAFMTAFLSLLPAHAATINLMKMALDGGARSTASHLTFLIEDPSRTAGRAIMASIPAPSPISDPFDFARTVTSDPSILSEFISFIMQLNPGGATADCSAGPGSKWIETHGIQNSVGIGFQGDLDNSNAIYNVPINFITGERPLYNSHLDIGTVITESASINDAGARPRYSAFNGTASAGFCPRSRPCETLERNPPNFDPRRFQAMASRPGVYGERKTPDVCELQPLCEWLREGRFNGTAAAGFCPRPAQWEALERNPPDPDPRHVQAMTSSPGVYRERQTAEVCQMLPLCERPRESRLKATAAGFCPRSSPWEALERIPPDFDPHIAGLFADSRCRRMCATICTNPGAESCNHEKKDRPTLFARGASPFSGKQILRDLGVVPLGYVAPEMIAVRSGAWTSIESMSNFRFCTMTAAWKRYEWSDFHFDGETAVPELSTWTLMLVGLVGLGSARLKAARAGARRQRPRRPWLSVIVHFGQVDA